VDSPLCVYVYSDSWIGGFGDLRAQRLVALGIWGIRAFDSGIRAFVIQRS